MIKNPVYPGDDECSWSLTLRNVPPSSHLREMRDEEMIKLQNNKYNSSHKCRRLKIKHLLNTGDFYDQMNKCAKYMSIKDRWLWLSRKREQSSFDSVPFLSRSRFLEEWLIELLLTTSVSLSSWWSQSRCWSFLIPWGGNHHTSNFPCIKASRSPVTYGAWAYTRPRP